MAESDADGLVMEYFHECVKKEKANPKLPPAEQKVGGSTTVSKILKQGLGLQQKHVSGCEASILPKYWDKKTKKVTDEDFVNKVLPEVAALKIGKTVDDEKSKDELGRMKKKLCDSLPGVREKQAGKNAAVVDRLTDTTKYTGTHVNRFDDKGQGKGIAGRENVTENTGYVPGYTNKDTFDKKH